MVFSYWLLGWRMKNNSSTSVEGVLPRGVPLFFAHALPQTVSCAETSAPQVSRERLAIRTIEFAILVLFMICPRLSYLLLQIHVPAVALTICIFIQHDQQRAGHNLAPWLWDIRSDATRG